MSEPEFTLRQRAPQGESQFELEQALLTTQSLPFFGLEEQGLQLEAGKRDRRS